ncbi:MAG TPA: hypothetical protein VIK11_11865 [Tepidiformaceae bacterium]
MRLDDFWVDDDRAPGGGSHFNAVLIQRLRRSPLQGVPDSEAAIALSRLLHDELTRYGTDGSEQLSDDEARDALRTLVSVTKRLGIQFDPPFRDLSGFRAYWGSHGGHGSWAARRSLLQVLFDPLHAELELREDQALNAELAESIAPTRRTGWPDVDEEIAELRRHFHSARTSQDYRNIGNDIVSVLEKLSEAAYDPGRHLRAGEVEPPAAHTKNRLGRIVEVDSEPEGSEELTKLAKATIELAQAVKHNPSGSKTRAGVASDAVILLANMLRRLQERE